MYPITVGFCGIHSLWFVTPLQAWQWQWALHLLELMPAAKVPPNEVSFTAAISACEKAECLGVVMDRRPLSICFMEKTTESEVSGRYIEVHMTWHSVDVSDYIGIQ